MLLSAMGLFIVLSLCLNPLTIDSFLGLEVLVGKSLTNLLGIIFYYKSLLVLKLVLLRE